MLTALSKAAFDRDIQHLDARSARLYGWTIVTATYPIFDVIFNHPTAAALRLRLTCTDWDELPPSIELLNKDGNYLTATPPNVGSVFHPGPHPSTGRLFVCMRGSREYHTHSSHTSDLWDNYRGKSGMDLAGIVQQLWRAWKRSVR